MLCRRIHHPPAASVVRQLVAALALSLAAGAARADVLIAVAAPLSGNFAVLGEEMKAGAEQAVADINQAGGVNGEPLRLEVMDDACDAKNADAVANQLAGKGVAMVVGHLCLGASIAASTVYAANKIVEISPATTFPKYTDERPGPGVFRLAGRDDEQALVAGSFLATRYADKNITIVDDNSAYGKSLADATRQAMNGAGKKEVFTQSYQPGAGDFSDLVFRLKASNVDVLYVGGYHTDVAHIARQMRDQAMATTIVAGDAIMTEEFWQIAGDAGEGTRMTFAPDPRKNPNAADVVREFRERGIEPEGYVLAAYAAVQVWAEAAAMAGSAAFDPVVAILADGRFKTVLGDVSFDQKGDVNLPGFVFYEWKDGGYDYLQM
jgi:branched-chain amino acid transport system substrate-binding protein